jgi:Skp family chaperone for outer membrane proteins
MKNNVWFILACILVFFVGYNMNDVAVSLPKYRVAVIDVPEVLSNSPEVQELKHTQDKEMEELNTLISKAQNELLNEQNRSVLLQKEVKYRKEIATKKESIDKEYNEKISKINEDIKNIISQEAKKEHYNLVLPTGIVISGGDDITQNVIKHIK